MSLQRFSCMALPYCCDLTLRCPRRAPPAGLCRLHERKTTMSFETLNLHEALTRAVATAGYTAPTDVQTRAIPPALAGQDLMVSSNTGSGKTASFVLPALWQVR